MILKTWNKKPRKPKAPEALVIESSKRVRLYCSVETKVFSRQELYPTAFDRVDFDPPTVDELTKKY